MAGFSMCQLTACLMLGWASTRGLGDVALCPGLQPWVTMVGGCCWLVGHGAGLWVLGEARSWPWSCCLQMAVPARSCRMHRAVPSAGEAKGALLEGTPTSLRCPGLPKDPTASLGLRCVPMNSGICLQGLPDCAIRGCATWPHTITRSRDAATELDGDASQQGVCRSHLLPNTHLMSGSEQPLCLQRLWSRFCLLGSPARCPRWLPCLIPSTRQRLRVSVPRQAYVEQRGKRDLRAKQSPGTSAAPEPPVLGGEGGRAGLSLAPWHPCCRWETFGMGYRQSSRVQGKRGCREQFPRCPGSCSAHRMSTEVTSLVTRVTFQKSCRFWLRLLLPLLSSGLGTPGCPCIHGAGVLLGTAPAGGTVRGPIAGLRWVAWAAGHASAAWWGFLHPQHLKSEAVRAELVPGQCQTCTAERKGMVGW